MRLTLASMITLVRLAFLPPVVWTLVQGERLLAVGILLVAQSADLVDGAIARRRGEVTRFGRLLDPVVDKLVFATLIGALAAVGELPWAVFALFVGIQLAVLVGGLVWLRRMPADPPAARPLGKLASFVLSLAVLAAMLDLPHDTLAVMAALGLLFVAGLDYLVQAVRTLSRPAPPRPPSESERAEIGAEEGP